MVPVVVKQGGWTARAVQWPKMLKEKVRKRLQAVKGPTKGVTDDSPTIKELLTLYQGDGEEVKLLKMVMTK